MICRQEGKGVLAIELAEEWRPEIIFERLPTGSGRSDVQKYRVRCTCPYDQINSAFEVIETSRFLAVTEMIKQMHTRGFTTLAAAVGLTLPAVHRYEDSERAKE